MYCISKNTGIYMQKRKERGHVEKNEERDISIYKHNLLSVLIKETELWQIFWIKNKFILEYIEFSVPNSIQIYAYTTNNYSFYL